jgi:rhodanese-related sulfurtransferase
MSEWRISPAEALRLMREQGYTYLDVRTQTEFELGHPAGARNLPWVFERTAGAQPNPRFVETAEEQFGRDGKLIVGCHTANRSAKAAAALRAAGFTNVLEQRAGWAGLRDAFGGVTDPGWEELGLPIER